MNKIYFGIGSRNTPFDILLLMYDIGAYLGTMNYTLRSGGCVGADRAFMDGCDSVGGSKDIIYASDCTPESMAIAERLHPSWGKCKPFARKLLGRNPQIILGKNMDSPCQYGIYYAEENEKGLVKGGTRTGIDVSRECGIKSFNLYFEDVRKKFIRKIYYGK